MIEKVVLSQSKSIDAQIVNGSIQFEDLDLEKLLSYSLNISTIAMYKRDCLAYTDYACIEMLDWLHPDTLVEWRDCLNLQTTKSPNTINRMISSVKRIVKELAKRHMINEDISIRFDRIDGVKVTRNKNKLKIHAKTMITPDEMKMLCESPDPSTLIGKRDRAILYTLGSSGLRASELTSLTLDQVQKSDDGYTLLVRGKTDREFREAHLSVKAFECIQEWIMARSLESPYLFTSFRHRASLPKPTPISETALWNIVTHYAQICNLSYIKPHDFRRFVATQLAKNYDLRIAQLALGHKDIRTTANYDLRKLQPGLTDNLF